MLLLPLALSLMTQRRIAQRITHLLTMALLGLVTLALGSGVVLMMIVLRGNIHAIHLLRATALLWISNILVFALWFWNIDGGGPFKRSKSGYQTPDFNFQRQVQGNSQEWTPHFLDYVFLAYNTATTFGPAGTEPVTHTSKALMMTESFISLLIITLIAARLVNAI